MKSNKANICAWELALVVEFKNQILLCANNFDVEIVQMF